MFVKYPFTAAQFFTHFSAWLKTGNRLEKKRRGNLTKSGLYIQCTTELPANIDAKDAAVNFKYLDQDTPAGICVCSLSLTRYKRIE